MFNPIVSAILHNIPYHTVPNAIYIAQLGRKIQRHRNVCTHLVFNGFVLFAMLCVMETVMTSFPVEFGQVSRAFH